MNLQGISRGRF